MAGIAPPGWTMTTLSTRQTAFLVLLFVITSFSLITLDNRTALEPLKAALHDVLTPISRGFARIAEGPGGTSEAERELAQVSAERDALKAENIRLQAEASEIDELRAQVDVRNKNPELDLLTARVINRDPAAIEKFVTIDKGSEDGVRVGMVVVDPQFYLGQVTEVGENTAKIMLIIDVSQRVGARLLDSRADGIIAGRWQMGGRLELLHVSRDIAPEQGEAVITSDITSSQTALVPPNLLIGYVGGDAILDRQNDTLVIPVIPAADFEDLDVVTVILSNED
ncbi:MAG: rod shape-determining protein MreC [Chloroflexota bacterium]|nr:rod shape-determining protein MreC [Chloroflexota bacterium]